MEARHLSNIRQVTFDFAKAGEGYFRPDGKAVIFQAAKPGEQDYQIYTLELAEGARPKLVSTGKGKCTCSYYHPDGKSILFASTHLAGSPKAGSESVKKKSPAYSRSEKLPLGLRPRDGHLSRRARRLAPRPPDRRAGVRRRGELFARRQADHLHLVPRRRRRDLHHGRRRQGPPAGDAQRRATTAAPSSRPDGKKIIYRSDRKQNDMLQVYHQQRPTARTSAP